MVMYAYSIAHTVCILSCTFTHTHMHTCVHAHTHLHPHTHMHVHTHTHTHTHIHTYTHIRLMACIFTSAVHFQVSGLFARDEMDEILQELITPMKRDFPRRPPSNENLQDYYMSRVRQNLHVVLSFSPVSHGVLPHQLFVAVFP